MNRGSIFIRRQGVNIHPSLTSGGEQLLPLGDRLPSAVDSVLDLDLAEVVLACWLRRSEHRGVHGVHKSISNCAGVPLRPGSRSPDHLCSGRVTFGLMMLRPRTWRKSGGLYPPGHPRSSSGCPCHRGGWQGPNSIRALEGPASGAPA